MTPQQALQILDKAAADFRGTRADHQAIATAVALLEAIINKQEEYKDNTNVEEITAR
jgi:hypothetical protein